MDIGRIEDRLDPAGAVRRMVFGPDGKIDVNRMTANFSKRGEFLRLYVELTPETMLQLIMTGQCEWMAFIRRMSERLADVYWTEGSFDTPEEALEALLKKTADVLEEILFGAETKQEEGREN